MSKEENGVKKIKGTRFEQRCPNFFQFGGLENSNVFNFVRFGFSIVELVKGQIFRALGPLGAKLENGGRDATRDAPKIFNFAPNGSFSMKIDI